MIEFWEEDSLREFSQKVETHEFCLVVFFATWCGPCKMFAPVLEMLDNKYENLHIIKLDIDKNGSIANHYSVESIPTTLVFKIGEVVAVENGILPLERCQELVEMHSNIKQI